MEVIEVMAGPRVELAPCRFLRYGQDDALDAAARRLFLTQWPGCHLPRCEGSDLPLTAIALCDDQVLGCASVVRTFLPESGRLATCLSNLVVASPHRRQGLGRQIVRWLMQEAAEVGERRLYAVSAQRAFFQAIGWSPVSTEQKSAASASSQDAEAAQLFESPWNKQWSAI
jgi:predicted N-acetyltransferase YhbS